MGHVGCAVADDLAFHAVVAVRIVRHVVLHREAVLSCNEGSQLQIFGAHRRPRTPTSTVVDPRSALRVQGIVSALLHDLPTPLLRVVHFHAVRVVAEFCAVVSLTEVVPTRTRFQPPHFFAVFRRVGLGQNGGVPVAEVVGPLPESGHVFDIPRWRPFDEGKLQIEQFLPVAALQLHAVLQQGGVIRDIKHPRPPVGTKRQVDAIGCDVAGDLIPIDDLKRFGPVIEVLVVVRDGLA